MKQKKRAAEDRFHRAYTLWIFECEKNAKLNIDRITKYNAELHDWTTRKINYEDDVHKTNEAVDDLAERYLRLDPEAVVQVFSYSLLGCGFRIYTPANSIYFLINLRVL